MLCNAQVQNEWHPNVQISTALTQGKESGTLFTFAKEKERGVIHFEGLHCAVSIGSTSEHTTQTMHVSFTPEYCPDRQRKRSVEKYYKSENPPQNTVAISIINKILEAVIVYA